MPYDPVVTVSYTTDLADAAMMFAGRWTMVPGDTSRPGG
jgi:hypothetical protein